MEAQIIELVPGKGGVWTPRHSRTVVGDSPDILGDILGAHLARAAGGQNLADVIRGAAGNMFRPNRLLAPGVATPGQRVQWFATPRPFTFSTANGLVTDSQDVNVQRPMRGRRIVASVVRTAVAGGNEASRLITLNAYEVAHVPQDAARSQTPIEAFAPTAFGLDVDIDSSTPGSIHTIVLGIQGAVAGVGAQIDVSFAVFGEALR